MSILDFHSENKFFFSLIQESNLNSEINLQVKSYFIQLQKMQSDDISEDESNKISVLHKYANQWNKFIESYPQAILYFSDHVFNTDIICNGWTLPHCYFSATKFRKKICFSDTSFRGICYFGDIEFDGNDIFNGAFFNQDIYLGNIVFLQKTNFDNVQFDRSSYFEDVEFKKDVSFHRISFSRRINFKSTKFEQDSFFNIFNRKVGGFLEFEDVEFSKDTRFSNYEERCILKIYTALFKGRARFFGAFKELILKYSIFEKEAYFEESFRRIYFKDFVGKRKAPEESVGIIDLTRNIFNNVVIFDITFDDLPDFSKAIFHKQPIITDKSLSGMIKSRNIKLEDEAKFRFLKDYFLKQNDHQKEMKYFEFEMMSKFKGLVGFRKLLYWMYGKVSNYGNSITKPFYLLIISGIVFSPNFISSFKITFLTSCFPSWIATKQAWILANIDFLKNSTKALTISFTRTVFPLLGNDYLIFQKSNFYVNVPIALLLQSVINLILLFLLVLGIRNEFKIK